MTTATPAVTTGSTTDQVNSALSGTGLRVIVFVAGFIIVPTLAEAQPELVNGLLLLILAGIILTNYRRWLPYLTGAAA